MGRFRAVVLFFVCFSGVQAIDLKSAPVSINLKHEKGSFGGDLGLSLTGTHSKAQFAWNGTIKNLSPHRIFRVTLCVKPIQADKSVIRPGGNECALRLFARDWGQGESLNFKGSRKVKISDEKTPVQVTSYQVEIEEIFDHAPNLRHIVARCPLVWAAGIRVFADKKFRPTVMDKDSFTATYAFEGGRIDGWSSKTFLKAYTSANTAFLGPIWDSFRIDSASLYLREEKVGECTAEVKMSFAGFGKTMFGTPGWYAVDSNFNYEKAILDEVEVQSKAEAEKDMDKAISQLPNAPPTAAEPVVKPEVTITSTPAGAEITIADEYIGSTPTTLSVQPGALTVVVKKPGFKVWERSMNVKAGDKRTVHAELDRQTVVIHQ